MMPEGLRRRNVVIHEGDHEPQNERLDYDAHESAVTAVTVFPALMAMATVFIVVSFPFCVRVFHFLVPGPARFASRGAALMPARNPRFAGRDIGHDKPQDEIQDDPTSARDKYKGDEYNSDYERIKHKIISDTGADSADNPFIWYAIKPMRFAFNFCRGICSARFLCIHNAHRIARVVTGSAVYLSSNVEAP